jgi:thiol:disulfide interchange protein
MLHRIWKQRRYALIVALLLTVAANPLAIASKEIQWAKTLEEGMKAAQKAKKPLMLDFYTDW